MSWAFEAEWGGLRIDVLSSRRRFGRRLVPHTFPKRDGSRLEDLGREAMVLDLDFVFLDVPGEPSFYDRFFAFEALVRSDETRTLFHPVYGAIACKVSDVTDDQDADNLEIRVSATFTEDIAEDPTFQVETGADALAGAQDVRVGAIAAGQELDAAGLSSTLVSADGGGDVATVTESWELFPERPVGEVAAEMSALNNALDQELNRFAASERIDLYPVIRSYTLLQYTIRQAARAYSAPDPRVISITVREPLPLRIIAGQFYGAREADRRTQELRDLNPNLASPALLPSGTVLRAYAQASTAPRR